jgi:endonuclease/exonuclease/phosphatase family metal-dependent hydrolase
MRQLQQFISREIPPGAPLMVAGEFNDWGNQVQVALAQANLTASSGRGQATFPSRLPLVQLDYVYARGLLPMTVHVPRGRIWGQMSDHLPLIAEFGLPD